VIQMLPEHKLYDRIISRWDVYAQQATKPDVKGRYGYYSKKQPLTQKDIENSILTRNKTIGTYVVNHINNTVVNPLIDIDNHNNSNISIKDDTIKIYNELIRIGYYPYIECSSGNIEYGVHIGLICQPTDALICKNILDNVLKTLNLSEHEVFPKQIEVNEGNYGNLVKLPFQFNNRTQKRSEIVNPVTLETFSRNEGVKFMLELKDSVFPEIIEMNDPIDVIKAVPDASCEPIKAAITQGITFDERFKLENIKPCIRACYNNRWVLHGKGDAGHDFRLAIAGNLLYNGAADQQVHEYFKTQTDYDLKKTNEQIKSIKDYLAGNKKPMGCKKLIDNCKILLNGMCDTCENKPKEKKVKTDVPIPEIASALKFTNNYELAEQMQERQPIYFDNSRNYWLWKLDELYYRMIDKTDILNSIIRITGDGGYVVEAKQKGEIIEAIGLTGRNRNVQEVKASWTYCKNGVYDCERKEIFKPTHEYFFTQPIPHNIGTASDTPTIDKLFTDWMGDKAPILYEICAYCLYNGYPIHRMFWLFGGQGRNGKDQFLEFIQRLVGKENAVATDLEILLSSRFESSKLYKKKVAVVSETNFHVITNPGLLKALTGHSYLRGEFKGKDGFDFYNVAKLIIATNALPETSDKTKAFFSRCITLEFKNRFAGKEFNKSIIDTIPEIEYENLIKKCFDKILPDLLETGEFYMEGTEEEKEKKYERLSNPFLTFKERELKDDDMNLETPVWVLRNMYEVFCRKNNYRNVGEKEFTQILHKENYETKRKWWGKKNWQTVIGLSTQTPYVYIGDEETKAVTDIEPGREDENYVVQEKRYAVRHEPDEPHIPTRKLRGDIRVELRGSSGSSGSNSQDVCGICELPLDRDSEFIGQGLGNVHPECKGILIPIQAVTNIPPFVGYDKITRSMKQGEIASIPIINAKALINKKAAVSVVR